MDRLPNKLNIKNLINSIANSEESAIEFFLAIGFLKNEICTRCGDSCSKNSNTNVKTGIFILKLGFVWYCKTCKTRTNPVRPGSWFEKNRLTFVQNILLIYCWAMDFSVKKTVNEIESTEMTVIDYFYFLRFELFYI